MSLYQRLKNLWFLSGLDLTPKAQSGKLNLNRIKSQWDKVAAIANVKRPATIIQDNPVLQDNVETD